MKFGIVTFPGSNCDYDAYQAVVEKLGEEATYLWHKDHDLKGSDVIILPGGFSYGDYLRAGAIARFSPVMQDVIAFAKRGGPVLAICNGFQIACEAGLLPGVLMRNAQLKFICRDVYLRVERSDTAFSRGYNAGQVIRVPVAHGEGNYVADAGRSALIGFDVARVVVALHLEHAGESATDVDHARVLARSLDDAPPGGRQPTQMYL